MLFKKRESRFVPTPEGKLLDAMLLVLKNLFFEFCDVLAAPIIGAPTNAKLLEHLGALRWSPLFGVKGNDAPRDQILPLQVFVDPIGKGRPKNQGKNDADNFYKTIVTMTMSFVRARFSLNDLSARISPYWVPSIRKNRRDRNPSGNFTWICCRPSL